MVVLHCLQVITSAISAWFRIVCKSSLVLSLPGWYYLLQVTCNALFLCLSESEYWQQAQGGAQEHQM
ncbi:hypothetical protein G6F42_023017 [Rhizopus arrhizus]|nr:hypothetical protein G6F42_023017 [Rhizopus arrhizus]